jgi:hypothetical protein
MGEVFMHVRLSCQSLTSCYRDITLRSAGLVFDRLMADFQKKFVISGRGETEFQEFNWAASKDIVDEIDALLSEHYGFSDE